jgi:dephospho-CoA kinase
MKRELKRPFLVGVTGGIGSGKSTVCHFLAEMGCALFEADRVAKELQCSDPQIIAGIRKLFGNDVYFSASGASLQLDRRRVASEVFSNPEKLRALNHLVHPAVHEAFRAAVEAARQQGREVLVKEAAILFETGRTADLDLIVVVVADTQLRLRRAVEKGLGSREEVLGRMASQWPQEKLLEKAGYVIHNEGSEDDLRRQTEILYEFILQEAASGRDCSGKSGQ